MELKRRKFQGVLNILSFNRHFYEYGVAVLIAITLSQLIFGWSSLLFWFIFIAFIYGLTMPLIVSAYVYDFSGYYNFDWMKDCDIKNAKNILNINAGFDETSFLIEKQYPNCKLKVFDFYNADQHTEPAIVRARRVSLVYPNTEQIATKHIPVENASVDAIFLLSAVHEIRNQQEKIEFLKECRRVCKPNGQVIMVEHLRDFPNFLAFSVGFTHFFSRKTWKNVFLQAGFSNIQERKFTPFMTIFKCSS